MKAIAINGSARAGGNTEILLERCLAVLADNGISGELTRLSDKTILPCRACGACFKNKDNRCSMQDDAFQKLYDAMREADIILLGSPVYFGSATANLTALLDRAGYVARANGNVFSRKIGGPVVVARRAGQNFTFMELMHWFHINRIINPGSTYWNVAFGREKGEVEKDEEGMNTVWNFGKNLAALLKKVKA